MIKTRRELVIVEKMEIIDVKEMEMAKLQKKKSFSDEEERMKSRKWSSIT